MIAPDITPEHESISRIDPVDILMLIESKTRLIYRKKYIGKRPPKTFFCTIVKPKSDFRRVRIKYYPHSSQPMLLYYVEVNVVDIFYELSELPYDSHDESQESPRSTMVNLDILI